MSDTNQIPVQIPTQVDVAPFREALSEHLCEQVWSMDMGQVLADVLKLETVQQVLAESIIDGIEEDGGPIGGQLPEGLLNEALLRAFESDQVRAAVNARVSQVITDLSDADVKEVLQNAASQAIVADSTLRDRLIQRLFQPRE